MTTFCYRKLAVGAAALLALGAAQAQADKTTMPLYVPGGITPATSHTSPPSDWRLTSGMTFNGVSMDGVARLYFDNDGSISNGGYICSGALLAGGRYVLTAAHCADDFNIMQVDFGLYNNVATATRTGVGAVVHPDWTNTLGVGADIAIVELSAPVVGIQGFNIATTSQVGQTMLIVGYGTTGQGNGPGPNWNEWGWGHWGYNQADVGVQQFDDAWYGPQPPGSYYGDEYVFDFDNGLDLNNTLQRVADQTSGTWTSSTGLGANEAIIAGGDSGGPDFVWDGSQWLVAGVHSWGWQFCNGRIDPSCDVSGSISSSYGDLSGSTAVDTHAAWIASVTAIPEPGTYALMLAGLAIVGGVARRRRD